MLGGSGSDAEDVMQDVFLRAYRALRLDERPVSLRAWLYRVAHNRCIDHVRRPTPAPAEIFELSRTPIQDPLAEAERREDLRRLIADVRRLPEQQRSALLMREMSGMSYADLATALDTSVPAVKSLLVRARIGLVEAIEARDADCADIRLDLAASYEKGVRASGRARRHLRECSQCTQYREQLRGVRQDFAAALSPSGAATGLLAKLLGLGGAGSAAGGAASGTAVTVGGAAAVSIPKVAALVCCAAVMGGGALEVQKVVAPSPAPSHERSKHATAPATIAPAAAAVARVTTTITELRSRGLASLSRTPRITLAPDLALHPPPPLMPTFFDTTPGRNGSGGAQAPDDPPASGDSTATAPDKTTGDPSTEYDGSISDSIVDLPTDADGATGDATTSATGTGSSGSGSSTSGSSTSGSSTGSGSSTSGSSTSGSSTSGSSSSSSSGTSSSS